MNKMRDIRIDTYEAGTFICKEGDRDFQFYILQEGVIEICTHNEQGEMIVLNTIQEGEAFGEFSLLAGEARSAHAFAVTDCVVVHISDTGYQELLNDLPEWASSMMKSLVGRIKTMNAKIKSLEKSSK